MSVFVPKMSTPYGRKSAKEREAKGKGAAAQRSGRNAEKTPATPRAAGGIVGARASPSGGAMVATASAAAKLREAGDGVDLTGRAMAAG